MKTLTILTLLILLAAPAHARLGETEAECAARYGTPVKSSSLQPDERRWRKGNMEVTVAFVEGRAVVITFMKRETRLSDVEIETLLNANGNGWRPAGREEPHRKSWMTDAGEIATLSGVYRLDISAPGSAASRERAAAARDHGLEGF